MFFWRMRAWTDFAQMTGTFILTLFFSIEVSCKALSTCARELMVDWPYCQCCLFIDPRRAKVNTNQDKDYRQITEHRRMGTYR